MNHNINYIGIVTPFITSRMPGLVSRKEAGGPRSRLRAYPQVTLYFLPDFCCV